MTRLLILALFFSSGLFADNKKFSKAELKLPGKKGVCFTLRTSGKQGLIKENLPKIKALNAYWNYSWHFHLINDQPKNMEFLPMSWGAWGHEKFKQDLQKYVVPKIKSGQVKRFLAFNEPDKKNQANMPYKKALSYWPLLEKLGVPLASPGCANPESIADGSAQGVRGTWMNDFMKEADSRGYRIDYIATHWYGGCDVKKFKEKMRRIYEKYGRRPLLITEFAVADWRAKNVTKNRHPKAKVLEFMKEVLPWLEEQDWIAGYSWFSFRRNEPPGTCSALFDMKGNMTALGRYYKSVTTENPKGDQSISY
ncbi:MAG: glycoside hydrolase family protein [Lentisphaerales bacterium]|nr:glycoside hydrolase family protein [Lentisphaerales bacterium]